MKRLLGYDYLTGLKTFHEYDHQTKMTTIAYEHDDVSPVLKWNQDLANAGLADKQKNNQMWHAATVPESVILQWRTQGVDIFKEEHWPMVRKKLNDPEWAYLRTWKGNL